ncbi:phage head closure protein [Cellulosilyticum lentocellum]|uniref:Prophage pi2 protein n=1 Tax=Cellulosilyticum lentocellum (strain ATCC 49066 / DSM 5427 / NCIMB 11756 / RHM5) TaxID=642492 RepID=F2JNC8_CELLD|nr:phage head closure protein [Cellulosilyticum lentocellum]ADZ83582.1 prophage pi2 protein [Cellulosilyticum lentocellum DSM 5427]
MRLITPIYFASKTYSTDEAGDQVIEEKLRKVLSNKKSVGTNEFYQAHTAGMKPEFKIEVRKFDYKGEDKVIVDNVSYKIIRTYDNQSGFLELTLEGDVHVGS